MRGLRLGHVRGSKRWNNPNNERGNKMDKITVNGVEYQKVNTDLEKLYITCVDNRGLTFIGRCSLCGDSEQIVIRDARCVIYWGTTLHIAELVNGPTPKTKLGAPRDVIVFRKNLVFAYEADEKVWS